MSWLLLNLSRVSCVAAMLLAVISWGAHAQEVKPGAPAPPAPDNKPAEFVGSATCQACHEDIFNAFQKNPHQAVEKDKKRGFENNACESCHGPGSKHVAAAKEAKKTVINRAVSEKFCRECHTPTMSPKFDFATYSAKGLHAKKAAE